MAKTPPAPKPTAAELDLLRLLWPLGRATVKQRAEVLQKITQLQEDQGRKLEDIEKISKRIRGRLKRY